MVIYLVPHITGQAPPAEDCDLEWAEKLLMAALSDSQKQTEGEY